MKSKEKEQILDRVWKDNPNYMRDLMRILESIPTDDSPTIKEVKEYCERTKCLECKILCGVHKLYATPLCGLTQGDFNQPKEWNIAKITEVINGQQ